MSEPVAGERTGLSNTIGTFNDLVAAGTPAPGGGSVAAYCGVLASSLGQMVCSLTIGKQKYADAEPRLIEMRSELDKLGARLRELIAEDAASFEAVLESYRAPKETEEQKASRASRIQVALRGAVDVPVETASCSLDVLKLLRELADIGNTNALSDVAVGAQLARTAVKGASYNVGVNLDSLSDREAADATRREVAGMLKDADKLAEEVDAKI
jgi:formiminotetrahydrofolate cyclodeaminase